MNKTLVCAALIACCGTAFAASNVTLYGVVDGGVTVSKKNGGDTLVKMTSGNWAGSRWGIKGVEDLGNGYVVGFQLEQGYSMDTGAASKADKAFNRQSSLYVKGGFGELGFGRFGGLSSDLGSYSILGGSAYSTSFSAIGDIYSAFYVTDRYNNSIVYVSPEFGGFQISAMYSNGIDEDTAKWSKNAHYYGLGATYNAGALSADLIYEVKDNKDLKTLDDGNYKATQLINLGGSYDFGSFKLYGAYEYAIHAPMPTVSDNDDFVALLSKDGKGANFNAFSLSVSAPVCGGTAMLQTQYAFGKMKDEFKDAEADRKFQTFSVGATYLYNFSKRTMAYANAGWGTAKKAAAQVNDLKGWVATIGVNHKF